MEIMTPFPVPTHNRLQDTIRAVILTKEKPSFPVPIWQKGKDFIMKQKHIVFQDPFSQKREKWPEIIDVSECAHKSKLPLGSITLIHSQLKKRKKD